MSRRDPHGAKGQRRAKDAPWVLKDGSVGWRRRLCRDGWVLEDAPWRAALSASAATKRMAMISYGGSGTCALIACVVLSGWLAGKLEADRCPSLIACVAVTGLGADGLGCGSQGRAARSDLALMAGSVAAHGGTAALIRLE